MIVKTVAYGRFSSVGSGGHPSVARARAVKYMANRPAKNISSLESQMIVPTLTMFGRVKECTRDVSKVLLATGAVVTGVIMASAGGRDDRGCDGRGGKVISSLPSPPPTGESGGAATRLGRVISAADNCRSGHRAGLQPPLRDPRRRADGGRPSPRRRRRSDHLARVRDRRRGRRRRRPRGHRPVHPRRRGAARRAASRWPASSRRRSPTGPPSASSSPGSRTAGWRTGPGPRARCPCRSTR